MRHIIFQDRTEYPVALLIKDKSLKKHELQEHYLKPLKLRSVDTGQIVAVSLRYDDPKKVKASTQKAYLEELLPELDSLGTKTLLVCDPHYFKTLTKQRKAEPHIGYVLPCAIKDYEHLRVIYAPNYQSLFYSPENQDKLDLAINALADHIDGSYAEIGKNIIHTAAYPTKLHEVELALENLHNYSQITCDIETFSLKFHEAGIGTIAFAWDQHNGVAFRVDNMPDDTNKVYFGAYVTLEDDKGETFGYRLVGPDEIDPYKGYISIDSPMGKTLLGKTIDSEISISTPTGKQTFWVIAIEYRAEPA